MKKITNLHLSYIFKISPIKIIFIDYLTVSDDVVEDGARLPRRNLFTLDLKTPRL